jgi:hypothetical protein
METAEESTASVPFFLFPYYIVFSCVVLSASQFKII